MIYVYPKFSRYELIGVRIGGAGLGNLLFSWSRSMVVAKKIGAEMIWPTWPSFKIGPWLRKEKDKRVYGDLFKNKKDACGGVKKYLRLLTHKKTYIWSLDEVDYLKISNNEIIVFNGYQPPTGHFQMDFNDIRDYRDYLREKIFENLGKKGEKALTFDASKAINVHIRLGDFVNSENDLARGINSVRIPISWYVAIISKIRTSAGWLVPVNIFSDGSDEEIADVLKLPNVRRKTFGNSIADIIALSKSPLMIASGSSFSMWARFLGNSSSISYPKQMKDSVASGDNKFEIELSEKDIIPINIASIIRCYYE